MEYEFVMLLTLLYQVNAAAQKKKMHFIRVLTELTAHLDDKSVEHLVSYGEYLVEQLRKKTDNPIVLSYQAEQVALPM